VIAWWRADGNPKDSVGDNHGTLKGGVTFAPGVAGKAFRLDGAARYVEVPRSDRWGFGRRDFSIELWVQFRAAATSNDIGAPRAVFIGCDEGNGGSGNKWFFAYGGGFLNFHIHHANVGGDFYAKAAFEPDLEQWYHLAVTRSGGTFTVYMNGASVASQKVDVIIPNPDAPLTIGQAENLGFFSGLIDEVAIYDRALSPKEVKARWSALAAATKPVTKVENKLVEVRRFRWDVPRDYFHSNINLSPDGRLILAAPDMYGPTKVWDAQSGQFKYQLAGGKSAFLPQGKQILALNENHFSLYETETGRLSRKFGFNNPGGFWFHSMWLAPNGKTVVSQAHSGTLQLWDVETGQELKRWENAGPGRYSPESSHILLYTNEGLRAWDIAANKETDAFNKVANRPRLIAVLPGARRVVESNADGFAVLDAATGEEVRQIRWDWKVNDEDAILGNLSVDGRRMLTFHKDQTVRLQEEETGRFHELGRVTLGRKLVPYADRGNPFGRATHLCFSADGRYAAAASNDGDLIVLRLPDPPPAKKNP
jgi:WD40 repeat protein